VLAAIHPIRYMLESTTNLVLSEHRYTYIMITITIITMIIIIAATGGAVVLLVKPPPFQPTTQILRHLGL